MSYGGCDCGARWRGESIAHCAQCCNTFTSDSAFDRHTGRNGCSDPARLRNKSGDLVFVETTRKGVNRPVWAFADDRPLPFSAAGKRQGDPISKEKAS